jgi:hypothetical protein
LLLLLQLPQKSNAAIRSRGSQRNTVAKRLLQPCRQMQTTNANALRQKLSSSS